MGATAAPTIEWLPQEAMARSTYEKYYSQKDRAKMDAGDFAGPHRSFPIMTQQDVYNAARLVGHAEDPAAVKAAIMRIAKRKGFKLPDSWQKEEEEEGDGGEGGDESGGGQAKESAGDGGQAPMISTAFAPKPRIARLRVCWIETDAVSLNGRQYPRETVEKLVRNAQTDLANPEALPITCFISHSKADEDNSRELVGRATEIWMEGTKGYAYIDIPDTGAGRDIAALAAHEYLTTVSLRASGVMQQIDRARGLPQVVEIAGERATLNGIDITTNPGLSKVARIQRVILEAAERPGLAEAFDLLDTPTLEEQHHMTIAKNKTGAASQAGSTATGTISEEALPNLVAGGVLPGTDGDQTADSYQSRMMALPPRANQDQYGSTSGLAPELESALGEAHDRIAMVQGRSCAPSAESAYGKRLLQEAGRALSGRNDSHLDVAHDHLAHALGKDCEGVQNKAGSGAAMGAPPDGDDDMEAAAQRAANTLKEKAMTPQEMAAALAAAGYKIEAPKTKAQLLEEQIAAQAAQIAELKTLVEGRQAAATPAQQAAAPQRRSLVEGANVGTSAPPWQQFAPYQPPQSQQQAAPQVVKYRNGDYLRERFSEIDWARLADRSYPLPEWVNAEWLVNELAQTACAMLEEKHQAF